MAMKITYCHQVLRPEDSTDPVHVCQMIDGHFDKHRCVCGKVWR